VVLPLSVSCGESRLVASWCAGGRCEMTGNDEDHGRSRRPGAEDWGWSSTDWVLGGWIIERSAPCTMRRGAWVSWFGLKTKVYGLSVVWTQNHWVRFPGLGLKTGSYGLVIWSSKSPCRFVGLSLKTKQYTIYRLHLKIDERTKTARGTRRDLAACFAWKQVGLGFPSLTSRLVQARRRWCMWHQCGGCVELKLKTDMSM
jgi:hypothetical protein